MSILRQDKCLDSGATITDESVLLSIFFHNDFERIPKSVIRPLKSLFSFFQFNLIVVLSRYHSL
jgi:hypothetical protein